MCKDKISNSCHNYVSPNQVWGIHYTSMNVPFTLPSPPFSLSLSPAFSLSLFPGDRCPRLSLNLSCSSSSQEAETKQKLLQYLVTRLDLPQPSPQTPTFLRKWKKLGRQVCVCLASSKHDYMYVFHNVYIGNIEGKHFLYNCIANVCLWMTMLLTVLRTGLFWILQSKANVLSFFSLFVSLSPDTRARRRRCPLLSWASTPSTKTLTHQLWRHSDTPHYSAEENSN